MCREKVPLCRAQLDAAHAVPHVHAASNVTLLSVASRAGFVALGACSSGVTGLGAMTCPRCIGAPVLPCSLAPLHPALPTYLRTISRDRHLEAMHAVHSAEPHFWSPLSDCDGVCVRVHSSTEIVGCHWCVIEQRYAGRPPPGVCRYSLVAMLALVGDKRARLGTVRI